MLGHITDMVKHGTDQLQSHPGVQAALSATLVAAGITLETIESTLQLISIGIGCVVGIAVAWSTIDRQVRERRKFRAWERDRARDKRKREESEQVGDS